MTSSAPRPLNAPAPPSRALAAATVATVMAAAAVAQGFGRFTFGVVLPDVREDLFDGSNALGGFVGTANTFAYLIGALAAGSLAARLSPVGSIRIGLTLSVSGLALAAFAPNPALLTVAMIAMGLGGAAIWIPSPGLTAAVMAPERRGLAAGLTGSGVGLGIVFSGQLNGWVHGRGGTWRDVYTVHTVIGLITVAAVLALLRNRGGRSPAGGFGGFAVLSKVDGWRQLTGCYFIYGFGYLLVMAFLTARLQDDNGFSQARASAMYALAGATTIVGGVIIGRISDSVGRRRTLIVSFPLWALAVAVIMTGNNTAVIVGVVMIGLLFAGVPSTIAAYLVDRTDETTYGPSYAAATFAFGLAQVCSPQVGGLLADWQNSFTIVFVVSAISMCVGTAFAWALPPDP